MADPIGKSMSGAQAAQAAQAAAIGANAPTAYTTGSLQKDAAESPTEAKFGELLKRLQSQYGAKAEKPREIKKTLGKDDFLRIMITQMQHQDPTSPFKAEQMAQEMAQFTSLEQMQNMNRSLEKMTAKDQPLERLTMTNLIGKTVTIDRSRFQHVEGTNESLSFNLPREASEVKIALVSEAGEVILEKDLGKQAQGEGSFSWDGLKSNTLAAKTGTYMLRVEAKDERGISMETGSTGKARVVGISFEGSEPVFLVGDAKSQVKVGLKNITRIDDNSQYPFGAPAGVSAGTPQAATSDTSGQGENPGSNFFTFKKGEGSTTYDPSKAAPEVADAIAKYQASATENARQQSLAQQSAAKVASLEPAVGGAKTADSGSVPLKPDEKGFPNGLKD